MVVDGKNIYDMSRSELDHVKTHLMAAYKNVAFVEARAFKPGMKVWFNNRGFRETGIVTGVNTKTVTVKTERVTWRISPSLLSLEK